MLVYDETQLREPNLLVPGRKPSIHVKPLPIVENWIRFPEARDLVTGKSLSGSTHGTVVFKPELIYVSAGAYYWSQTTQSNGTDQTWILITELVDSGAGEDTLQAVSNDVFPRIYDLTTTGIAAAFRGYGSTGTFSRTLSVGDKLICVLTAPVPGVAHPYGGWEMWVFTPHGELVADIVRNTVLSAPLAGTTNAGIGYTTSGYSRSGAVYDCYSISKSISGESEARRIAIDPYQFLEAA